MHRRPLGRARLLAIVAAIVILVGCVLPWYALGGGDGLPLREWRVFDGTGILAFLAALLTIALVSLPYATAGRPVAVDAWPAYLGFLLLAAIGVALWALQNVGVAPAGLLPDRAPGFWLTVLGTLIMARAVFEIHSEPVRH
ncbi:MAG TPA: hypothetical protein VEY67_07390 [Candidatus Dormibacteraeota bacterium]|nr:hypothetical protein [Candidatus Dormibacteraeota bacterium]